MATSLQQYAQSFFDLCLENNWLEEVYEDLGSINTLFELNDDFNQLLTSPVISAEMRQEAIDNLFKGKLSEVTYRFLLFLEEKGHMNLLSSICQSFLEFYTENKNIIRVEIASNSLLDKKQIDDICQHLRSRLQKEIDPEFVIDQNLLGGFKVKAGDIIYDYSLKHQLEKFKRQLV